jgi:hypothetical protein
MTSSMKRKLLATLAIAALAASAMGVAIGTAAEDPPRAGTDGSDVVLDPTLAEKFAVLTTIKEQQDTMPEGLASGRVSADLVLNADLARRANTYDNGRASYVVPGDGGLCLALVTRGDDDAAGLACNSTAEVDSNIVGPASQLGGCVVAKAGQPPRCSGTAIYGLAPDGVSDVVVDLPDGTTRAIKVENNVYLVDLDGPEPNALSWRSPTGETLRRFPLAGQ